MLDSIPINDPIIDSTHLTDITTDGTYLYTGSSWYYALNLNPEGRSKIYKFGTGFNGTVRGQFYGNVPNFFDRIQNSLFYYDGFLYVTTSNPYKLIKIDPVSGDTVRITIPNGLLDYQHGTTVTGSFYAKSNGQYVYNLTLYDSLGVGRYVLRVLDPSNNWQLVRPDLALQSTSFPGFTDFFVAEGYIYPAEYISGNKMRRIRLSDGLFEEEWIVHKPFQSHFSWCYDQVNDKVFSGVYRRTGYEPMFYMFKGTYSDAQGTLASVDIGPASKWNSLNYDLNQNTTGSFSNILYGLNNSTKVYDTLAINIPEDYSLQNISTDNYKYLKLFVRMTDTTFNTTNPMEFKNLYVDYVGLPEIMITKNDIKVTPDSVLQGLNTTMHFSVKNVGYIPADNVGIKFYFNDSDSVFFNPTVNIQPDSTAALEYTFSTTPFIFDNNIRAIATYPKTEYFTFNNLIDHSFYVERDSINPLFNITFDGKEIIDGDLVSSKPEVVITLKDNSPLPLDTSYFTLIHSYSDTVKILHFSEPDLDYSYSEYPNSEAVITWHPNLTDGTHALEILAKDASGNFFDTTSYRVRFDVVTEYDLRNVYNYPNPFKNGTYFTFKITGDQLPDELYVKIYTVAGRLIRTLQINSAQLGQNLGFKKVYWDGKDEDGDEVANGVYFYKMIYKLKDVVKTVTQKLAKIK